MARPLAAMVERTQTLAVRLILLALLAATIGAASAAADALDAIRLEHQLVLDDLNVPDEKGRALPLDDARTAPLLRKGWDLAGAWAAEYLETHPSPSPKELEGIFKGFTSASAGGGYEFAGGAVRIAPSLYVVDGTYTVDNATSAFMVVGRGADGRFRALWNVKDAAARHSAQEDEVGRWAHLAHRAYYNGPLVVSEIRPAVASERGHARFVVDAYQWADGGTHLGQLSVWEWDGAEAQPLLIRAYQYAADNYEFSFDGKTVRLTTKEVLQTLHSCGMCATPQGTWRVRISRSGVRDLGHRIQERELQWADDLLACIGRGEDAGGIASADVVKVIRDHMSAPAFVWWGMLAGVADVRRGSRGGFRLVCDEAELRLEYVRRNGRPYFTRARVREL